MKHRKLINTICVFGGILWANIMILAFCVIVYLLSSQIGPVDSYSQHLEIQAPSGWKTVSIRGSLNDGADIELMNRKNQSYLIAILYDKEDYEYTYDEFASMCFQELEELYDTTITDIYQLQTKKNKDWFYTTLHTTYEGTKLYLRSYVIETENYYVEVLSWATRSHQEYLDEVSDDMVLSIQEI